jgi:hypothetical protein
MRHVLRWIIEGGQAVVIPPVMPYMCLLKEACMGHGLRALTSPLAVVHTPLELSTPLPEPVLGQERLLITVTCDNTKDNRNL